MRRTRSRSTTLFGALVVASALAFGTAACGDDGDGDSSGACAPAELPAAVEADAVAAADTDGTTLRLVTHDSFAVSDGIFDQFEADTGISVELLTTGDAGTLVSEAVLTAGNPVGDVLFGIDNTFLCRGLAGDVFVPYESPALADVPDELELDPNHLVTPIDVGDVCVNYANAAYADDTAPADLDDLVDPAFADQFVTENPETSSPGFAFLLATIAKYGEDGWEDYWRSLRDNGVQVTNGWSEAYEEAFAGGSGGRTIVTSYAASPVVEVLYADPPVDVAPTSVIEDSCFRQVEFAGVLRGTGHPEAAAKLVDFLLSPSFQEDIPLNMFVEPANETAALPDVFLEHRTEIAAPLSLDPAAIEAGRSEWTERWTEIVLR
jgi:thiamine transport system substrate-binding protein